jgi:hypothetical protein
LRRRAFKTHALDPSLIVKVLDMARDRQSAAEILSACEKMANPLTCR